VKNGRISKDDQLLPLFVVDTMSEIPGNEHVLLFKSDTELRIVWFIHCGDFLRIFKYGFLGN